MFFNNSNSKPVHDKAKMYADEYAAGITAPIERAPNDNDYHLQ